MPTPPPSEKALYESTVVWADGEDPDQTFSVLGGLCVNYLHECPVEPKLPIYLVVGGCFGIVKLLFLLWKQIKRHKEDLGDLHDDIDLLTMTRMTNIALNIFHCVWFAFGHYWVFHIWKPHFVAPLHEPRNWCDETVFMFSFWQLIICHVVLAILLALSAVMCCCFVCVKCVIADAKR
nr:hypothetical protein BaRGS_025083 [Batillaria attramentaria]